MLSQFALKTHEGIFSELMNVKYSLWGKSKTIIAFALIWIAFCFFAQ